MSRRKKVLPALLFPLIRHFPWLTFVEVAWLFVFSRVFFTRQLSVIKGILFSLFFRDLHFKVKCIHSGKFVQVGVQTLDLALSSASAANAQHKRDRSERPHSPEDCFKLVSTWMLSGVQTCCILYSTLPWARLQVRLLQEGQHRNVSVYTWYTRM